MDADYSVELGADDPTLVLPWTSEDGSLRYYDLRARPDLLLYIDEAAQNRELGEFLNVVNAAHSRVQSVKCDVWTSKELSEAEAIYGAAMKFCSYVDVVFSALPPRLDFAAHEEFAATLVQLLNKAPEISAAAEFIIRRCHYEPPHSTFSQVVTGFYITFYLSGYGDDEADAQQRWAIALRLIGNAIVQISAKAVPGG